MGWIYLLLVIVLSTALWPVARWALLQNGNPRVMGFWISLTACVISLTILLIRKADFYVPGLWIAALGFAVAYAVGFNILIMRGLQLGPTGPTVTINNSAMIFGVLAGVLWLEPHVPNSWVVMGIAGVFVALALIGFGGRVNTSQVSSANNLWLRLVLAGGALSGLSFVTQAYVGVLHPGIDNSLLFTCLGFGLSAIILFASLASEPLILVRRKRELTGGIVLGISNTIAFSLTILAFQDLGAEIVLPVSVTTPMVLVLFIGAFAYGERLSRLTWVGCLMAVLSVGAMGYGSTLKQNIIKREQSK